MLPHLMPPDKKYKDSFADAMREGLRSVALPAEKIAQIENDFDAYLAAENDLDSRFEFWQATASLYTLANGRKVKRVPFSVFWLVAEDRFLGEVSIRHVLTPELIQLGGHIGYNVRKNERRKGYGALMLELALAEAKKIGLQKVLLTCNDDNEPSIKIIEGAGGVMQDKIPIAGRPALQRRYWIGL